MGRERTQISNRTGYLVANVASVPGLDANPGLATEYNRLSVGCRVIQMDTGARYTKTNATPYGSGGADHAGDDRGAVRRGRRDRG